jgi:hypothetical protein
MGRTCGKGRGFGERLNSVPVSTRQQMRQDRLWFEEHPEHQVLLRSPYSFEVADYERKTGVVPRIVLVYELAEGARYRVFGGTNDLIEVERYVLGTPQIERQTVAECLQGARLPYGSHLGYSLRHSEMLMGDGLA